MTRIRFEDLPSTNTPRNAENLNKLNNVVIGTTEPTTGEELWVDNTNKKIYAKNDNEGYEELFNKFGHLEFNERGDSNNYNDFIKNGFYQCNFQNGTNAPNIYATGMLLVFGSYYISQLFIGQVNETITVYTRFSGDKGTTWTSWKEL